ncbi:secretin N-terminal domain-containing protein [Rhodopirellula halodulae]|uniref:secretin N-terminal domain-containing protein n=1 Tax=Rhodopirellula halodulae TaxID=2894198 RepID=UPI001E60DC4C|nr:secretin N-terminal domain-containing protein [Rhodopirellula sp. JC737]MCC9658689.1 general secretion pathway protein [Rhodopirellula sp. JC737]
MNRIDFPMQPGENESQLGIAAGRGFHAESWTRCNFARCVPQKRGWLIAGLLGLAVTVGHTDPAAAQEPAAADSASSTVGDSSASTTNESKELRFNFSGAPWGDVLRWFSEQADLSLQLDASPAGTVNFSDPTKTYSIGEGLDLINRLLLDRGWALVRRGRMLLLVDLEAENAEKLISEMAELVTPESFEGRGNSDIVRCVFPLGGLTAEEAREELSQIIGPWGRINVLGGARQVVVTETVGKLKTIQSVLSAAEEAQSSVVEIALENRAAEEILEIARPLVGLEPGMNLGDDLRISVSLYGDRVFATGDPAKLALLKSIFTKADKPIPGSEDAEEVEVVQPVLKTHSVASANLQTAFDVLQTLLQGTPDTRIALDTKRGVIVASARPETQQRIASTIAELEGDGDNFAIINLKRLEPANALLTINKFFGVTETGGQGPTVDGDPETGRLWVRGTASQIETVKRLIDELENDPLTGGLGENVRVLPLSGPSANQTLRQLESLWPMTGRENRLRVVVPNSTEEGRLQEGNGTQPIRRPMNPNADQEARWEVAPAKANNPFAVIQRETLVRTYDDTEATGEESNANSTEESQGPTLLEDESANLNAGADIVVQMTPAGLVIASKDTEALDAFEQLLNSISASSTTASDLPTVFRLKYIKADVASELVASVLGGAESSSGSLTESVMGGLGGGMLGGLLGMGGGGGDEPSTARSILTSRGSVNIVADGHLNSLIVQASPADLEFIRLVIQEIDQEESPELVRTVPTPKLIPVIYQEASSVAEIVKSVFAEKMFQEESSRGGGGGRQPSPEDFINAIRGGRGGRGGGGTEKPKSEPTKIIVAVDERSNSLVVTATPQDFEQVEELVGILDQQGMEQEEQTVVLPLAGGVRAEVLQQALESMLGVKATTSTSTSSSSGSSSSSSSSRSSMPTGSSPEDIRRRIEFFRSRFGGGGGTPGGFGGRGGDTGRGRGGDTGRGGRGGTTGGGRGR